MDRRIALVVLFFVLLIAASAEAGQALFAFSEHLAAASMRP